MYLFDELLVEAKQRELDHLRAAGDLLPQHGGRVAIRARIGAWLVRVALWIDPKGRAAGPSVRLVTH